MNSKDLYRLPADRTMISEASRQIAHCHAPAPSADRPPSQKQSGRRGERSSRSRQNTTTPVGPSCPLAKSSDRVSRLPKANINRLGYLRADAANGKLFDHFVGGNNQRGRDHEAKRLVGFQVDRQLELDWELDGKITRLLAL